MRRLPVLFRPQARPDLLEGLRTVSFERSAVIAYRVERGAMRVFYGGRDVEAFYADGAGDEPREPSS